VTAESWDAALAALYQDAWQPELRRYRLPMAFRGVPEEHRSLDNGLARLQGDAAALEGHLLRNFRKYGLADASASGPTSIWHVLALAQHHGLPTRLLDWTYSPLVALHFVTERASDADIAGVVWAIDFARAKTLLPAPLREALDAQMADVFTPDDLERVASSLDALSATTPTPALVFLEPPSLDQRIVMQYALFSLMTDASARMDDWVERHPALCRRVIITPAAKLEIRDKLDQANITERVIYPGLDGLCRWLKRYYERRS
jgi:hypothetical protein